MVGLFFFPVAGPASYHYLLGLEQTYVLLGKSYNVLGQISWQVSGAMLPPECGVARSLGCAAGVPGEAGVYASALCSTVTRQSLSISL